jgi:hypothetical protein
MNRIKALYRSRAIACAWEDVYKLRQATVLTASHPYELALGNYSVHTSQASLQAGERRIAEIQARLQEEGRL